MKGKSLSCLGEERGAAGRANRGLERLGLGFRQGPGPLSGNPALSRVLASAGLCCLWGCSLKDYDYLKNGGFGGAAGDPAHAGGAAGGAEHPGGRGEAGSATSADGGASGAHGEGGLAGAGKTGGAGGGADTGEGGAGGAGGKRAAAGAAGESEVTCDSGLTPCAGECIDLDRGKPSGTTFIHCGSCDTLCSITHATAATCEDGECVPECRSGYDNCNGVAANDGCEADLATASHCGECGRACSRVGATRASCADGTCTPECLSMFADCNSAEEVNDGCEVYLDDLEQCGTTCDDGVSCGASEVCNAGACGPAQGIVEFVVPFTEVGQKQRYGDKFSPVDVTNTTLLIRAYAPGAGDGQLIIYALDGDWTSGIGLTIPLSDLRAGWTDIRFSIGPLSGDFDPSQCQQVTWEVVSGASGPWPTVIYVDSVRSMNGEIDHTFDINLASMVSSSMQKVEGSTMTWLDSLPE